MENDKAIEFYEKLYFYELESREKLIARLQLSLGILTALGGVYAYMYFRLNFAARTSPLCAILFLVSSVIGTALIIAALVHFIKALWGHSYSCIPVASEIEAYRKLLVETYKAYEDGKEEAAMHFDAFLLKYFAECSSTNASVNEFRYDKLHVSLSYAVCSIPAILVSVVFFVAGGLSLPTISGG